jgi:hypothetical protein
MLVKEVDAPFIDALGDFLANLMWATYTVVNIAALYQVE